MKQYQHEQQTQERRGKVTGALLTLCIHAAMLATGLLTGLKYLDPPPPENTFLLDFSEEEEQVREPRPRKVSTAPRAENADPEKDVRLVQKSESPYVSEKPNNTPETKADDFGDVETPEPPAKEEPKLDPRASFPGMSKKDNPTTAPHAADEASDAFKAGAPDGNSETRRTDGTPNAKLKGRTVIGGLPRPSYEVQKEGTVVVQIKVDQYGNVKEAVPGAEGTTVTDKTLWNAARKAAMETHFNMSAEAPVLQQGTITYRFRLQ